MLVEKRRQALGDMLQADGSIVVSSLAKKWQVSEMTVRRDLKALADQGMVARVHGGAVAQGSLRFHARRRHATQAKQTAVNKLKRFLPKNGSVFIDGSSTMLGLCQYFKDCHGLRVYTHNIDIFQTVQQYPHIEMSLIGGRLDREVDNVVGPLARRSLEALTFDAAFLSAYGLDAAIGLSDPSLEDAAIKQCVVERSAHTYIAMNSDKFARRSHGVWGSTDGGASDGALTLASELAPDDERVQSVSSFFSRVL